MPQCSRRPPSSSAEAATTACSLEVGHASLSSGSARSARRLVGLVQQAPEPMVEAVGSRIPTVAPVGLLPPPLPAAVAADDPSVVVRSAGGGVVLLRRTELRLALRRRRVVVASSLIGRNGDRDCAHQQAGQTDEAERNRNRGVPSLSVQEQAAGSAASGLHRARRRRRASARAARIAKQSESNPTRP